MKLIRLTGDYELGEFDCGDDDLNEFLLNDAKHFQENGFQELTQNEEDDHTRLMYFDMMSME